MENPLQRSGLALAGVNRTLRREGGLPAEAEDGILTAEDVTAMDLVDTELVVLSACETGVGEGCCRRRCLRTAARICSSRGQDPDYELVESAGQADSGIDVRLLPPSARRRTAS